MIYVVRCTATGLRKIGSAIGDVRARFVNLQTGSAAPLILEAEADSLDWSERALHRELDGHRVRGEWFDVTFEAIESASSLPNVSRYGAIEWNKLASAWWTRVSARGLEPWISREALDSYLGAGDSTAPAPSEQEVSKYRDWIRRRCKRAHCWSVAASDIAYCTKLGSTGALIQAAIDEGVPTMRDAFAVDGEHNGNDAVFCMTLPRGAIWAVHCARRSW